MLKCKSCKAVFERPEKQVQWYEAWGEDACEVFGYCPECGSPTFGEAKECLNCFGLFLERELHGGYCEKCIRQYIKDKPDRVYEYLSSDLDNLNDFAAFMEERET